MIERSGGGRHQRQFWARAGSRPVCAAASCTVPAGSGSEWRLVSFLTGIIRHSVIHLPPSLPIHPALSACLREFRCFPVAGGKGVPGIFVGGGDRRGLVYRSFSIHTSESMCLCACLSSLCTATVFSGWRVAVHEYIFRLLLTISLERNIIFIMHPCTFLTVKTVFLQRDFATSPFTVASAVYGRYGNKHC